MSKALDYKRIKQLKKLKKLSTYESKGTTPKIQTGISFALGGVLISFIVGCFVDNSSTLSSLIIFDMIFIPFGFYFIGTLNFGNTYFYRVKKILDNYEPVNKKKYDYFINNFTEENSEFFWEYLDKFIESEKQA